MGTRRKIRELTANDCACFCAWKAVIGLHPNAYGISIQDRLEQVGHKASIGSMYAALDRLGEKGFVTVGDAQIVTITAPGQ